MTTVGAGDARRACSLGESRRELADSRLSRDADPERELAGPSGRASGSSSPATTSGRPSSTTSPTASRCRGAAASRSASGCAGRCRLDELGRVGRGGRVALRDDVRRRRRRRRSLPRSAGRVGRSCPGRRTGSTRPRHRGALAAGGPTVAVLACGADRVYPAAHRELIDHIAARRRRGLRGAAGLRRRPGSASCRATGSSPRCGRGTVVVEAALRSGALNTANWADRLSRALMGVPGPVTSAPSQGVHQLIRTGAATPGHRGAEVLELVGAAGEHLVDVPRGPDRPRDGCLAARARRCSTRSRSPAGAGTSRSARAGVGVQEAARALLALADAGWSSRRRGWRLVARSTVVRRLAAPSRRGSGGAPRSTYDRRMVSSGGDPTEGAARVDGPGAGGLRAAPRRPSGT